ncbi:hypothetical protein LR48_Vigan08g057000 [Vigna angularis]|uniref:Uncharacterized protein n=1 Tax=Phaseolus angularis TaxID=3914 RepID=A0A0L9V3Z9_PHAAN|nr:hypothetical protein LR48_Vigan08g057000 [Vigna angularis]
MPKVKRFRNLQKSTPQPLCVENTTTQPSGNSSPTNPRVSSLMIEDQPSQHAGLESSLPTENTQQTETSTHVGCESSLPTENTEQTETSTQQVGCQSLSYWTVDAIDLKGVIKKIKVKVKEVNNLPFGERIIVEFDEIGMPIGEGQGVLAGYCGILAICFQLILKGGLEKQACLMSTPNFLREMCKKNRENHNKQLTPHTGGSKPFSRKRHEMFMKTGQLPSRGKLYIETHKRKDGSFLNNATKDIAEKIEVGLTQSTTNESKVSPNDVVGKVLCPEHSGRVRCMGLGAAPTNAFRNTRLRLSDLSLPHLPLSHHHHLLIVRSGCSGMNNLESAFKAYMIMKEGKIPDELISFFDRQPQEGGDANEPESPLDTIGSSGASNI